MPKAGETYTYSGDEPLGAGNSGLAPGTTVTVREVVKADEKGAHNGDEDAVVVTWMAPTIVRTEDGNAVGDAERAVSIGTGEFGDVFTKES